MTHLLPAAAIGLFIVAISWMLWGITRAAVNQIAVNSSMGIRLPSLMRDETAWRAGHRAAQPTFFWSAVVTTAPATISIFLSENEALYAAFLTVSAVSLTLGSTLACIEAHRAALGVPPEAD